MSDDYNNIAGPSKGDPPFFKTVRWISAILATLALVASLINIIVTDDDFIIFLVILLYVGGFYISIPLTGVWIYSFFRSLFRFRQTKTDRQLLYFHCADIVLFISIILLLFRPDMRCDADIMSKHYEANKDDMRQLIRTMREELPESIFYVTEFDDFGKLPEDSILSTEQTKRLSKELDRIGCRGIEINTSGNVDYGTLRFRREGMGLYSFRLYEHPLDKCQKDSLDNLSQLIVYDDSTVFEYGGGVWGPQDFIGKKDFLRERNGVRD